MRDCTYCGAFIIGGHRYNWKFHHNDRMDECSFQWAGFWGMSMTCPEAMAMAKSNVHLPESIACADDVANWRCPATTKVIDNEVLVGHSLEQ
uniref:C-type lectin domain-containing protein n=1 Tax=Panagrellus redivivus TaxID=6233 RepID=A0A7E4UXG9_PANRE